MMRPTGLLVQDKRLTITPETVEACIQAMDSMDTHFVTGGSIEVAFVEEAESGRLHKDFFDDPEPTDVMTFPGDVEDDHAGDIAICPAIAAETCKSTGLPFNEELTLYLVHAWLHLAGLDDKEDDDRQTMRRAEGLMMDHLRLREQMLSCSWKD